MRISVLASPRAAKMAAIARAELGPRGHAVSTYGSVAEFSADRSGVEASDLILTMPDMRLVPDLMRQATSLRACVSMVTGVENIDLSEATRRGILVANGQVAESCTSMAEATIMLMLASLYDLDRSQAMMGAAPGSIGREAHMLRGRTVGLIGFGEIARTVAELLRPWGTELLVFVRHPRELPAHVEAVALDDLLRRSNIVAVLTNLDASSRGLLDERRLSLTREDVVLINTARGPIIDEAALVRVAQARPRMRLALDVFEALPLAPDHPLRALPNAILTPHVVGHTQETTAALVRAMIENVTCIARGELPALTCNPEVGPTWLARWRHAS